MSLKYKLLDYSALVDLKDCEILNVENYELENLLRVIKLSLKIQDLIYLTNVSQSTIKVLESKDLKNICILLDKTQKRLVKKYLGISVEESLEKQEKYIVCSQTREWYYKQLKKGLIKSKNISLYCKIKYCDKVYLDYINN